MMKHIDSCITAILILCLLKMAVSRNVKYDDIPEKCFHGHHSGDYADFGLMMQCAMNTKVRALKRANGGRNDQLLDELNNQQWRIARFQIAKQALNSRIFQII